MHLLSPWRVLAGPCTCSHPGVCLQAHAPALALACARRPMQLLPVGVVGLKWYNMHNERWLEALHEDGPGGQVASAMNPDDPSTVFVHGPGGYGGGYGGGRGGGSRRNVQAQQMDIQFQVRGRPALLWGTGAAPHVPAHG